MEKQNKIKTEKQCRNKQKKNILLMPSKIKSLHLDVWYSQITKAASCTRSKVKFRVDIYNSSADWVLGGDLSITELIHYIEISYY